MQISAVASAIDNEVLHSSGRGKAENPQSRGIFASVLACKHGRETIANPACYYPSMWEVIYLLSRLVNALLVPIE